MGGNEAPVLGGSAEPSWRTKVANILYSDGKLQPDECNYYLDQVEASKAHESAVDLRKLASQYEIFRSERMRLIAEGIRLAAELIDPEAS